MAIFRGKRRKEWRLACKRKFRKSNATRVRVDIDRQSKHLGNNIQRTTPTKTNKRKHTQGSSSKKQNKYSRLKTIFSPLKHSTPIKTSNRTPKRTLNVLIESQIKKK